MFYTFLPAVVAGLTALGPHVYIAFLVAVFVAVGSVGAINRVLTRWIVLKTFLKLRLVVGTEPER
jgi:hypothetical protein